MGSDGEPASSQGYVTVDSLDFIIVESVGCRREYPRNLAIEEDALIGVCFDMVIKHYLDGTGITDDCIEKEGSLLKSETSKKVLRKQVESYMESMGFEFRK